MPIREPAEPEVPEVYREILTLVGLLGLGDDSEPDIALDHINVRQRYDLPMQCILPRGNVGARVVKCFDAIVAMFDDKYGTNMVNRMVEANGERGRATINRSIGRWHRFLDMNWSRDGERVASVGLRSEHDRLRLTYRVQTNGADWQDVAETVPIIRVARRLGGARPYFICPGVANSVACGRRVGKLYGPGRYFLCRHCYRLAYASQSEGAWDRNLRRANRIRQRLGGDPGVAAPFPFRPRGMWTRTYVHTVLPWEDADEYDAQLAALRKEHAPPRERPRSASLKSWPALCGASGA